MVTVLVIVSASCSDDVKPAIPKYLTDSVIVICPFESVLLGIVTNSELRFYEVEKVDPSTVKLQV